MATKKGVWGIQDVKDKITVSEWDYDGAKALYSWGYNRYGVLGQNQPQNSHRSSPVQIPGSWHQILCKYSGCGTDVGVMGTKADGSLWTWGNNNDGQLGQNQAEAQVSAVSSPVQVGSGTDWGGGGATSIYGKMAAIKTDGSMYMWGSNGYSGGLGLNGPTAPVGGNANARYSSPVQIGGTWKTGRDTITGLTDGFLAINAGGELLSWGRDWYGSTGQNVPEGTRRSSPVKIGSASDWATVSDGGSNKVGAINTSGELYTWGRNELGELGHNNQIQKSAPIQVPGTSWKKVSMTEYNTLATKTDGTLWAWGKNEHGQLGQNEQQNDWGRSSPMQIPGTNWDLTHFQALGQGASAMKTDGTLWSWGENENGQLGHNNRTRYSSPNQIPGTTWYSVDLMNQTSFGLKQL